MGDFATGSDVHGTHRRIPVFEQPALHHSASKDRAGLDLKLVSQRWSCWVWERSGRGLTGLAARACEARSLVADSSVRPHVLRCALLSLHISPELWGCVPRHWGACQLDLSASLCLGFVPAGQILDLA